MSKKKSSKEEQTTFEEEDMEDFGELEAEASPTFAEESLADEGSMEEDPQMESLADEGSMEEDPEVSEPAQPTLLVTSLRTFIYKQPYIHGPVLTGVVRGNQLRLLDSEQIVGEDNRSWYHVEKPGLGEGFIEVVRVKTL